MTPDAFILMLFALPAFFVVGGLAFIGFIVYFIMHPLQSIAVLIFAAGFGTFLWGIR